MALANDSEFGLAQRLAGELETGGVFINGYCATDPRITFGGVKKSGFGRELSTLGARILQCPDGMAGSALIALRSLGAFGVQVRLELKVDRQAGIFRSTLNW